MTSLRAVFTVTVETRPDGDYYFDHADFVRHVGPWIEGGLYDRDDIRTVTITEQPAVVLPEPADRAAGPAALREAAAFYEGVLQQSLDPDSDPRYCTAVRDVVMGLRHRADAAQQPTSDRCPHGCNVSTCPCLACEADQPAAVSQPDKEEA
jgi:hypothetical protein